MTLVIGGYAAGKTQWVTDHLGYTRGQMSNDPADDAPVLRGLEDVVFADPGKAPDLLDALLRKDVVICTEVGCGVIPVDPGDRLRREAVGRLCVALASRADRVVRVVCGLGQSLKGSSL